MIMNGPQAASGPAFGRTSTRSAPCVFLRYPLARGIGNLRQPNEAGSGIADSEQTLRRLDAEVQAWLNHPSASTWSQPQRDEQA